MGVQRVLALVGNAIAEYVGLQVGAGPASAGQLVALNASGLIDTTMAPLSLPPAYTSRAAAMADFIPTSVSALRIKGWSKPGDGGDGDFVRMDSSTALLTPPAIVSAQLWHFQTADGAWWLRWTHGPVNFQMFGAGGSASADDTAAIQASLNYHPTVFGTSPVLLLIPAGTHNVTSQITCLAASPCITTLGSDDLVTISRGAVFAGHTMQFGNPTTGCQRLVLEGIHFDVPTANHWLSGAGKSQAAHADGAVILAMDSLSVGGGNTVPRLLTDQPHELSNGDRIFLYQTGGSAYERRTFLVSVVNSTYILLKNLNGSTFYSTLVSPIVGDGVTKNFTVSHGMGSYLINTALVDANGNAVASGIATVVSSGPNTAQVDFAITPASGATYTLTTGLANVLGGTAGVVTGPLCAKVYTEDGYGAGITAATQSNPCTVTFAQGHQFAVGDMVAAQAVGGMTQLNGNDYLAGAVNGNTISLYTSAGFSVDSTGFSAFTGGGNFSVVAQSLPSYVTATLDNLVPSAGGPFYHVMAWYPTRGRIKRVQGLRTNGTICAIGDSYMEYDTVSVGGVWDSSRPGLQETTAGFVFPAAAASRTCVKIRNPLLLSLGIQAPPQVIRRGNGVAVQKVDIGMLDGCYCEQAEGFEATGGYLGGHNGSLFHFRAMGVLVHVNLHDFFNDGSHGYSIHFELGTASVNDVTIHHVNSNGGDVCDGFLLIDDGTGTLAIPHVGQLVVDHNIGQGYRCAPIALLGVDGGALDGNSFFGYNQLGDTSGNVSLNAGAYIGPNSANIGLLGGQYGGGVNVTLGANNCRWGVYSAAPASAVSFCGVTAPNLGQAGGAVTNLYSAGAVDVTMLPALPLDAGADNDMATNGVLGIGPGVVTSTDLGAASMPALAVSDLGLVSQPVTTTIDLGLASA